MSDVSAHTGPITGNVPLYKKPEPLTVEAHGKLGVKSPDKPFAFMSGAHFIPMTVAEFAPAGLNFPIIFMGDTKLPAAVMGLNPGENLFVDAEGVVPVDVYVPAFVRRWPFVLAQGQGSEQLVVCIDRDADVVSEEPDAPFFENGEISDFTKTAIQFCENFETERQRTEAFIALLNKHDLFELKTAQFTPRNADGTPGQPQQIADYYGVSETKLRALAQEDLAQLRDNGALQQIYAHLMSLLNWEFLIARAMERQGRLQQAQAAGNA